MNFVANKNRYFYAALLFACISIIALLTVAVRAWNNPTQSPSGGSGAVSTDGNLNVIMSGGSRLQFSGAGEGGGTTRLVEWGTSYVAGQKLLLRLSDALNGTTNLWDAIELSRTSATAGNVNLAKSAGKVVVGNPSALTNDATTLIAQNSVALGTAAGNVAYPFEFRANSGNDDRLLLMNYRRSAAVAGLEWKSAGWRLQGAVDNVYTAPNSGIAYVELYNGGGGVNNNNGEIYLGTAGADRIKIGGTGLIDVLTNRITNLGNPTAGSDAVTKDYVDRYGGVGGASPRIWGQGRPGSVVLVSGGECTSSLNAAIKVSRSDRDAHWDSAAAVCPVGWWVCTAAERGTNACNGGAGQLAWLNCNPSGGLDTNGQMLAGTTRYAWVADVSPATSDKYRGKTVNFDASPVSNNEPACSVLPVWCCSL